MSFSEDPPVETITGWRAVAIFSISIQSLRSELAILMIGMPSSTHRSTDASSKGVAMGTQPRLPDGLDHRREVVPRELRVEVFLM